MFWWWSIRERRERRREERRVPGLPSVWCLTCRYYGVYNRSVLYYINLIAFISVHTFEHAYVYPRKLFFSSSSVIGYKQSIFAKNRFCKLLFRFRKLDIFTKDQAIPESTTGVALNNPTLGTKLTYPATDRLVKIKPNFNTTYRMLGILSSSLYFSPVSGMLR